nr:retrotransposon Orf1 [Tanacetum cinerariifolium]
MRDENPIRTLGEYSKPSHKGYKNTSELLVGNNVEMSKRVRNTRGQASSSREETMEEKVRKFGLFDYEDHQMNYDNLAGRSIYPEDVVDWEFLSKKGLAQLGGVEREMYLLELGWRVGLYSKRESKDVATCSGLRRAETVNSTHLTHLFWPSVDDDRFNVGNTKAKSIRDPRIKLAHRCITMTITGRKETTNRVTEIDLFYLYCIFGEGIVCNIPYWLTKYLKGVRHKSDFWGDVCNKDIPVLWFAHQKNGAVDEDECNDEEGNREGGNEGAGGFADIYRNMSAGDWQVRHAR